MEPAVSTLSKLACLYSMLFFELCQENLTSCSFGRTFTLINAQEPQVGTMSSFNQAISLDWLCTERLTDVVFVSYGSGASSAVCRLLKELVISKGANISPNLTTVYLGGPPLESRSLTHSLWCLFWGCGSLHTDLLFQVFLSAKIKLFKVLWQRTVTSDPTNIHLHSVLHPFPHNSVFI